MARLVSLPECCAVALAMLTRLKSAFRNMLHPLIDPVTWTYNECYKVRSFCRRIGLTRRAHLWAAAFQQCFGQSPYHQSLPNLQKVQRFFTLFAFLSRFGASWLEVKVESVLSKLTQNISSLLLERLVNFLGNAVINAACPTKPCNGKYDLLQCLLRDSPS